MKTPRQKKAKERISETIIIPETHPSINTWKNWHFQRYNSEKKRWAEMIGWLCKDRGVGRFDMPVQIEVVYFFKSKQRHDIDNYTPKFILDALVDSGIIKDDNSEIVTKLSTVLKYDKLNPRTEVTISYEI